MSSSSCCGYPVIICGFFFVGPDSCMYLCVLVLFFVLRLLGIPCRQLVECVMNWSVSENCVRRERVITIPILKGMLCFSFFALCLQWAVVCAVAGQEIPLSGGGITKASLATADFNGDGYKEIVAGGGDGMLYVLSTVDGVNWETVWSRQCNLDIEAAGPPTHKDSNEITAPPAIADLDGDGHLDIVVGVGGRAHVLNHDDSLRDNGGVLVFRYNSAWSFSLIEALSQDGSRGWPQPRIDEIGLGSGYSNPDGYWDGVYSAPALGDLDGDGDLEIVVAGADRRIHAWHHTGEVVAGWPIHSSNGDHLLRGGIAAPALGDIDGDGLVEVIVATNSPPWKIDQVWLRENFDYSQATLWAINGDSSIVPGFPVATEQFFHSSPALADINQDGFLEIIIGSGDGAAEKSGRKNIVSVYSHEGVLLPNWPQETGGLTVAPPALADIDNDGALEVIIGCGSEGSWYDCGQGDAKLYVWNADGSSVAGFPISPPTASILNDEAHSMPYSPIVADIDGDGALEILIVQSIAWGITVVESDGAVSGYRHTNNMLHSPPLVDDVDNDGKIEILVGGAGANENGAIYIWDEAGSYIPEKMPWPMDRKDILRTGQIGKAGVVVSRPSIGHLANINTILSLLLNVQ